MQPTARQIEQLKEFPELAETFDAQFGEGAAAAAQAGTLQLAVQPEPAPAAPAPAPAATPPLASSPADGVGSEITVDVDPGAGTTEISGNPEAIAAGGDFLRSTGVPEDQIIKPEDEDDDPGFFAEAARGIGGGVVDAFEATGDAFAAVAEKLGLPVGIKISEDGVSLVYELDQIDDAVFGEFNKRDAIVAPNQSVGGGLVRGLVQFVTGFVGAGKFVFAAKSLKGLTGLKAFGKLSAQGAVADAAVFGSNDPRLSNLINLSPTFGTRFTEWLAASPDDGFMEGRFKNALEGLVIGAAVEPLFRIFRFLKQSGSKLRGQAAIAAEVRAAEARIAKTDTEKVAKRDKVKKLKREEADAKKEESEKVTEEEFNKADAELKEAIRQEDIKTGKVLPGTDDLFDVGTIRVGQKETSAATSINKGKTPAVFATVLKAGEAGFVDGGRNFDIGGGKFDNATELLRENNVENVIFDPFNRSAEHNIAAVRDAANGKSDTVTIANVLNVIDNPKARMNVLLQADNALKPEGKVFITVFEGTGKGKGKKTTKGFQANQKTADLLEEVQSVFPNAELRGKVIVATKEGTGAPARVAAATALEAGFKGSRAAFSNSAKAAVDSEAMVAAVKEKKGIFNAEDAIAEAINFDKLMVTGGIKAVRQALLDHMGPLIDDLVAGGTLTHERFNTMVSSKLADMMGKTPDEVVALAAQSARNVQEANKVMAAAWGMLNSYSREVDALLYKFEVDPTNVSVADHALLMQKVTFINELQAGALGIQKAQARGVASGRYRSYDPVSGKAIDMQEMLEQLKAAGGTEGVRRIAKHLRAASAVSPQALLQASRGLAGNRWVRVAREYFINSILSGPKTHIVNISSNQIQMYQLPLEKMVGGVLSADRVAIEEGARQFAYALQYSADIFRGFATSSKVDDWVNAGSVRRAVKKSFKGEVGVLDPSVSKIDEFGQAVNTFAIQGGRGANILGKTVRMPTRLLMTEDEFFKQVTYRAHLKAHLVTASRKVEGGAAKRAEFIEQGFKDGFDKEGRGKNSAALAAARQATFTTPLKPKSVSGGISSFVSSHPGMSFVLPFIRTPANILSSVNQRLGPLSLATSGQLRADIRAGGELRAQAFGKIAVSSTVISTAMLLASQGHMTGAGPSDPHRAAIKRETGWQKYSFVTTDEVTGEKTYTSFRRLDPQGMILGLAVDAVESWHLLGEEDRDDLATHMMVSLVNNLASKSYLTGVIDLLNAMTGPERFLQSALKKFGASFVPTGIKQVGDGIEDLMSLADIGPISDDAQGVLGDRHLKEARTFLEMLKRKIPGLDNDLPPRYSWITGSAVPAPEGFLFPDALSPYAVTRGSNNPVLEELASLQHGFGPPSQTFKGVKLNTKQYAELKRLHGTVKIGGRTMMEALRRAFEKGSYDIERKRVLDTSVDALTSFRVKIVNRIISRYRRKAGLTLMKRDDVLADGVELIKTAQRGVRRGVSPETQQLIRNLGN